MSKTEHAIWMPDVHAPRQHKRSFEPFLEYVADTHLDRFICGGDFYNIEAANGHRLHNRKAMEGNRLGREIASGKVVWAQVVKAARNKNSSCRIDVISGNHEDFLRRYTDDQPEREDI